MIADSLVDIDYNVLHNEYKGLSPLERMQRLFATHDPSRVLVTSSFGTTGNLLLHLVKQVRPEHPIHFINTGFHFPETMAYRDLLVNELGLNLVEVKAPENKHQFTRENQTYKANQDLCCWINKVDPLEDIKQGYDIWVSGLLAYQNANRAHLRVFEPKRGITKFHPLIDMTAQETELYRYIYELPAHPLEAEGYQSIGCKHCTAKGQGREGRWAGSQKTECGLHL